MSLLAAMCDLAVDSVNGSSCTADALAIRSSYSWCVSSGSPVRYFRAGMNTSSAAPASRTAHANFGIAHGGSGLLALLALAAMDGRLVDGQADAMERLCGWFDSWRQESEHGPWWPQWVTRDELRAGRPDCDGPGRPSWCYGVPGIARAQQLAAIATSQPTRQAAAEAALASCMTSPRLDRLTDPGICHGLADLDAALRTYRAAGRAALRHTQADIWFQALAEPVDWTAAEVIFATRIAPRLDQLDDGQAAWWFLRKHPCWRLRIRTADRDSAGAMFDSLAADGLISGWKHGIYEPEIAAFGGPVAMNIVHELFCADSRGVLGYARHHPPLLGRRELSLLLIRALQHHAGLDWFETADVFDRVARIRPAPAQADTARAEGFAAQVRSLLAIPVHATAAMLAAGGQRDDLTTWLVAFITAGQQLGEAAAVARLDRGLRAVVAHIVIFHWNRLGLSARTQGILARAATTAILPRS